MHQSQNTDPLHGITLQKILENLQQTLGWEELAKQIKINCFSNDPSIKSSLKFLRKTPWAREKVEQLYISLQTSTTNKSTKTSEQTNETFVWPDISKK
ncbi:VF530 family DNA-binding protein [Paraglaciecola sp. L3A3]|uniref:VF530 family protein n=1 Tax=Paraglaciecola sp. L3A3 TaxID=2686358 RepID=UPI00131CBBB5|nr:VF530 family protein [Paraglaciecola sp. L3A3]